MRHSLLFVLLAFPLSAAAAAAAQDAEQSIDKSAWKCKYCAYEHGISGQLEGGVGYVSQDSFKFGEYSGLNEQGLFLNADVSSRYRDSKTANYWDFDAADLGLDSRGVQMQGGKQGLYRFFLNYSELPQYLSDTARTPFMGSGGENLNLPASWVEAGSTTGMTGLDNSLGPVDLQTKRTQWVVGGLFIPAAKWETSIKYRHETREGKKPIAGSFYFNAVQMVQPVDYTTDLIDAVASYNAKAWQLKLAYHGSTFRNNHDSLTWQNPYTPIVAGADRGELALPPDNEFHQALASLALHVGEASSAVADVAIGRMTQNDDFLSATANSNLVVSPPPASSLDGHVDTVDANLKWSTQFSEKLRFNAAYHYNDRDNDSPQRVYDWVVTDVNPATPRTNTPYSFSRSTFKLNTEYRPTVGITSAIGYDYQRYERTQQEVDESREGTLWASFITRSGEYADFTLRAAHARREIDGYNAVTNVDPPENPLLKKYNMADRDRDSVGARIDSAVSARSTLGVYVDVAQDDYPDTDIGLTSSNVSSMNMDFSTQLTSNATLNLFLNREEMSSRVSNSKLYSVADWSGRVKDRFETAGAGIKYIVIENKLDVGTDYVRTRSRGKTTITDNGTDSDLPDLITRLNSVKVYANYQQSETLIFNASYWYESYSSRDWAVDNVHEDTVANNLSLGEESPSYNVHVFMFSVRYRF